MTTDSTRLARTLADRRDATDASGDAAGVTVRTLMRGDADYTARQAHAYAALAAAGLVGPIDTTPHPRSLSAAGVWDSKRHAQAFTPQRLAVLGCFAEGWSYTETAERLGCSVPTVKSHTGNLYRLFGVSSKVECLIAAVRAGVLIVTPEGAIVVNPTPAPVVVVEPPTPAPVLAPTADDLGGMDRATLQETARALGLRAGGSAAALRDRIAAHTATTPEG